MNKFEREIQIKVWKYKSKKIVTYRLMYLSHFDGAWIVHFLGFVLWWQNFFWFPLCRHCFFWILLCMGWLAARGCKWLQSQRLHSPLRIRELLEKLGMKRRLFIFIVLLLAVLKNQEVPNIQTFLPLARDDVSHFHFQLHCWSPL